MLHLTLLLATSCASSPPPATSPSRPLPILSRLGELRLTVRTLTVLRSPEDFDRLSQPNPVTTWAPVPEGVDWRRQMLIVAASGQRLGEGYSIRIEGVERTAEGLLVRIKETEPPAPRPRTGKPCYPTDVVVVEAMNVPVRFVINGFTERVWRPPTTRPAASLVERDPILRRFHLSAAARDRLEGALRDYFSARKSALRWWALHSKEEGAAEEYRRRRQAAARALGRTVREVLTPRQYAVFVRANAIRSRWRRRRRTLEDLLRNPATTTPQRQAALEEIRDLDRSLDEALDELFRGLPTTRPQKKGSAPSLPVR